MVFKQPLSAQQRFSFFIVFFAAIGGILYGYDLGIIAGALLFIHQQIPMTDWQSSILVAAVLGGGALATLVSGPLADLFGRRKMIVVAAIIFLFGVFSLSFAHVYWQVLMGRLTQGVGVGIVTITIPLYLAESLPAHIRGRGISAFQLLLTFGILLASLVGLYFTSTHNWRAMFLSATIPGLILLIGALFLPNSPRWLFMQGDVNQALEVLKKSRSVHSARSELVRMAEVIHQHQHEARSFLHAFKERAYLVPLLVVFAVASLQQLTGVNSILQFSAVILKASGLNTNLTAMLGSTAITLINFMVTIIALLLVDKIGRRKLLLIGTAGAFFSLFSMALINWVFVVSVFKGYLMLSGIMIFILSYAIGPGVVVWLVISELLPTKVRSIGMAVALFLNSITSTLYASVFLPLINQVGYSGIFLFSSLAALLYCLLTYYVIPETNAKSLEEIEQIFQEDRQPIVSTKELYG